MKNQNDHSGSFWNKNELKNDLKEPKPKMYMLVLHVHLGPWLELYPCFVCDS